MAEQARGGAAHLEVAARMRAGLELLDVQFALRAPWSTLFGASGSGKSTLLRAIAGLVQPEAGSIRVRGQLVLEAGARVAVPPHLRPVRMAAQMPRLFPGRTVRENLLFGARGGAGELLLTGLTEVLEVDALLARQPEELSGGEQQRVNVGRAALAAAVSGSLLLLDEPFTGMDGARRDRLAPALQRWLLDRGVPVLSVTHDVGEIFLLRPEVLRLEGGRIGGQGSPEAVLDGERERLLRQLGARPAAG